MGEYLEAQTMMTRHWHQNPQKKWLRAVSSTVSLRVLFVRPRFITIWNTHLPKHKNVDAEYG